MASNPTLITTPFAASGDKTTPPNTNTPSDGRFSQTLGFPPVTAIPLGSGGKAPKREDFNGAFNMISNILFYTQKGWIFNWDSGQSYYAGCIVRYSGNLYACTSDVTSTTNPGSDTTHWSKYNISPGVTYAPINSPAFTGTPTAPTPTSGDDSTKIATTAFVKAATSGVGGGYNHRDVVTSSGTYTAPVKGWYKITVKGAGGGGGGGSVASANVEAGGGGGEGGTTIAYEYLTVGTNATVTIGAGGSAGTGTTGGNSGGNSSVVVNGNTYTGGGGEGGSSYSAAYYNTGAGGSGTIPGAPGGNFTRSANTHSGAPGGGEGGGNGSLNVNPANSGKNGGGGAGGYGPAGGGGNTTGGAGGNGYVWFEYYAES